LELAKGPNIHIDNIDRAAWAPLFVPNGVVPNDLLIRLQNTGLLISYLPDPDGVFAQNLCRIGVSRVITHPPRPIETHLIHTIDHLLHPLHSLKIPTPITQPTIHLTEEDQQAISVYLKPSPTLLIHPGSGSASKRWPPECFAKAAEALVQHTGCHILLSSGPADDDLAQRVASSMKTPSIILPELTLPHLAALMTHCSAYLGNDSGPSHLAAAMSVPSVVLFGPTNPHQWAPRGPNVCVIQAQNKRINDILPDQVISKLLFAISLNS
jgi:ADP-heptose:LPS heptosyltransferase